MSKQTEALKLALEAVEWMNGDTEKTPSKPFKEIAAAIREALAEQLARQQEPVTVLPDGSAFAVMSYPLPKDHWLYADRQYNDGEYEPVELGKPVLTHELRDAVVSAVRYAIRGATNCGKEVDFDPDALVQNAVYALCGPFTSPPASKPWVGLSTDEIYDMYNEPRSDAEMVEFARAIEAKLREKNA